MSLKRFFDWGIPVVIILLIVGFFYAWGSFVSSVATTGEMNPSSFLLFIIIYILALFFIMGLTAWMLVDCSLKEFDSRSEKTAWILSIYFLSVLAAIPYYYIHARNSLDKQEKKRK